MNSSKSGSSLLRGSVTVGVLTLVSRVLGFFRELLVAGLLGGGAIADAFLVAYKVPNLLRSFFAEGAFTSGFVPSFSDALEEGNQRAQEALKETFSALVLVVGIVSIAGICFSDSIVGVLAQGFYDNPEQFKLTSSLLRVMFPYILFVSIVAMSNGALNTKMIFGVSALSQIVMNVVMVIGALIACFWVDMERISWILSITVCLGGICQVLIQFPLLKRGNLYLGFSRHLLSPTVRQTALLMLPAMLGGTVYQLTQFLLTNFASLLQEGAVSWLYYSDRLAQLPIGVFTMAVATVLLPILSVSNARKDSGAYNSALTNSLRFTAFFLFPISAILYLFAFPLLSLAFQRGNFSEAAVWQSHLALQASTFGLWAASSHSLVVRSFLAKKKPMVPALVGIVMLLSTFLFSSLFMGTPQRQEDSILGASIAFVQNILPFSYHLGHAGLALASALSSILGLLTLMVILTLEDDSFPLYIVLRSAFKSLVATLISSIVILTFQSEQMYSVDIVSLPASILLFGVLYLAISFILQTAELLETIRVIKTKLC